MLDPGAPDPGTLIAVSREAVVFEPAGTGGVKHYICFAGEPFEALLQRCERSAVYAFLGRKRRAILHHLLKETRGGCRMAVDFDTLGGWLHTEKPRKGSDWYRGSGNTTIRTDVRGRSADVMHRYDFVA